MNQYSSKSNHSSSAYNSELRNQAVKQENCQRSQNSRISDPTVRKNVDINQMDKYTSQEGEKKGQYQNYPQEQMTLSLKSSCDENLNINEPFQRINYGEDKRKGEEIFLQNIEDMFSRAFSYSQQVKQTDQIIQLKIKLKKIQEQLTILRKKDEQNIHRFQESNKQRESLRKQLEVQIKQNKRLSDKYVKDIEEMKEQEKAKIIQLQLFKDNLSYQYQQKEKRQKKLKESYEAVRKQNGNLKDQIQKKQLKIQQRIQMQSPLNMKINKLQEQKQRLLLQKQSLFNSMNKYQQLLNQAESKLKKQFQIQYEDKIQKLRLTIKQLQTNYTNKNIKQYKEYQDYKRQLIQMNSNQLKVALADSDINLKKFKEQSQRMLKLKQKQLNSLQSSSQIQLTQKNQQITRLTEQKNKLLMYQNACINIIKLVKQLRLPELKDIEDITKLSLNVGKVIQILRSRENNAHNSEKNLSSYVETLTTYYENTLQYINRLINIFQNAKTCKSVLQFGQFPQGKNKNEQQMRNRINKLTKQITRFVQLYTGQFQKKQQFIQDTKQNLQKLRKQYQIKTSSFEDLKQKHYTLRLDYQNVKQSSETLKLQEILLKKTIAQSNTEKQELSNSLTLKQKQNSKLSSQNTSLQLKIQQKQAYVEQLQIKVSSLSLQIEQKKGDLEIQKDLNLKLTDKQKISSARLLTLEKSVEIKQKQKEQECKKLKKQFTEKEQILKNNFDQNTRQTNEMICKTINKVFGSQPSRPDIDSIISFLSENAFNSNNTAFTVSHILQNMPKERSILYKECCQFLSLNSFSTKLSYKYDDNFRNFSFYLPSVITKFSFVVIFRSKRKNVFGVISQSVGKDSKSMAFNLNQMKFMGKTGNTRIQSTTFENNYLKFGNDEISIKNNVSLEIKVNTVILGQRYYTFSKQDLVCNDQIDDPIPLQAMEIHRISSI